MIRKKLFSYERRRMFEGMMFISIWGIGFICFMAYPLFSSLKISFTASTLTNMTGGSYTGLKNYKSAVIDPLFGTYFSNALGSALLDIPIIVIFSLFVAVLLNGQVFGRSGFRAIFFVPVVISGVVMKLLFQQNVADISSFGEFDSGLTASFLNADVFNRLGLLFWRSSVEIIIFLAGLQSIPKTQYEAAEVDGATAWESFWKITLPLISPVVLLNIIYAAVDSFTDPLSSMMEYVKYKLFIHMDFGVAAAMSWIYFAVVMLVIIIITGAGRRMVFYGGDQK